MFPWSHYDYFTDYVKQLINMQPNNINEYVKKTIESNIPYPPISPPTTKPNAKTTSSIPKNKDTESMNQNTKKEKLQSKVFESHEEVFVQFQVSDKSVLNQGKIFYNSNQLILKDIPNIGDEHKVLLPAIVHQRGARTNYKNGILQIRIPKADDIQFTEIDLHS